jgi:hypothetical protein
VVTAALVQKDVLAGVVRRQRVMPCAALRGDVSPPLFVGVNGFFYREVQLINCAPDGG